MRSLNVILPVLLLSFTSLCTPKFISEKKQNNLKIIDGEEVTPHSMPYMVAIQSSIEDIDYLCGGSLLSDSIVLTSARCVSGAAEVELILSAHDLDKTDEAGQQTVTATEFIVHEKYNPDTMENDIALVLLPEAVPLGDNINTIKLPEVTDILNTYDEEEVIVAGWGKTNDTTQATSNVLRSQTLTTIPVIICELSYTFNIKTSQICTSGVQKKNICRGDGGGPLVLNGVQIGIASYGSSWGCSIGLPAVYTRITSYLNWLLLTMS